MAARLILALLPLAIGLFGACASSTEDGSAAQAAAPAAATADVTAASATRATFPVEGMVCEGCQNSIQDAVSELDGVVSCTADHEKKHAEVVYDPAKVKPDQIVAAIGKLGYRAAAPGQPVPPAAD
jgi:copper chaperone CopZ